MKITFLRFLFTYVFILATARAATHPHDNIEIYGFDSNQNNVITIPSELVQYSTVLKNSLNCFPNIQNSSVRIENCRHNILQRIVKCLKIINSKDYEQCYDYLVNLELNDFFELMLAAHFLDISTICIPCAKKWAMFNDIDITNSYTNNISSEIRQWNNEIPPELSMLCAQQHPQYSAILQWLIYKPIKIIKTLPKTTTLVISPDNIFFGSSNAINVFNFQDKTLGIFESSYSKYSAIAISYNNNLFVSSSNDGVIKIYDPQTAQCCGILKSHNNQITSLAISPDNCFIISGSDDGTIKIWNRQTNQLLARLTDHTKWISALAISHNSQFIVSGSGDSTIKIWDLTGQCLNTLKGHTDIIRSIAISSDDKYLISGSDDMTIKIWDIQTSQCLHTLTGHTNWINSIALSHDDQFIVSCDETTIKTWDSNTYRCLHSFDGHAELIDSVAISHDDRFIVSSDENTIKIWDLQTIADLITTSKYLTIEQLHLLIVIREKADQRYKMNLEHPNYQLLHDIYQTLPEVIKDRIKPHLFKIK